MLTETSYVADGGTGDGKTDMTPVGKIADAYAALGDNSGTIVICGKLDYSADAQFAAPKHTGKVTVTQKYNGKDYRDSDNNTVYIKKGSRWGLGGPTTFENVTFKNDGG